MKIKNILVCAVALLVFSATPVWRYQQIAHRWDEKKVEEYIKTVSVVFVAVKDGVAEGAGVVIAPDGTTLTVAHLFDHGTPTQVRMLATNGNDYDLDILAVDSRYDLALVRPKAASPTFKHAKLASKLEVEINQDIMIVGHPLFYYYDVEYGVILGFFNHFWYRGQAMKISALVRPGNSGGPVFNTKGEVIGIVSAKLENPITREFIFGIAVTRSQIQEFFNEIAPYKKYWPKQIRKYRLEDIKTKGASK